MTKSTARERARGKPDLSVCCRGTGVDILGDAKASRDVAIKA